MASGKIQDIWCHREAFRKILARHRDSGPNLYEGCSVDWPFNIRAAVGRELFHIIINELRINLSAEGGLIIAGQVINVSGDSITTFAAPAKRASSPGKMYDQNLSPRWFSLSITSCIYTSFISALYKLFRLRKNQRTTEEVKPHPVLVKLFGPQKLRKIRFTSNELPMLVPSVPWLAPSHGGFLLETTNFVRTPEDSSSSPLESTMLENRLLSAYPVFDSLNQLGSTPWKINSKVLDLVSQFLHKPIKKFGQKWHFKSESNPFSIGTASFFIFKKI